jgi:hypothetical protein
MSLAFMKALNSSGKSLLTRELWRISRHQYAHVRHHLHDGLQAKSLEELVVFRVRKTAPVDSSRNDFTEVEMRFLVILLVFVLSLGFFGCLELLGNCRVC